MGHNRHSPFILLLRCFVFCSNFFPTFFLTARNRIFAAKKNRSTQKIIWTQRFLSTATSLFLSAKNLFGCILWFTFILNLFMFQIVLTFSVIRSHSHRFISVLQLCISIYNYTIYILFMEFILQHFIFTYYKQSYYLININ